MIGAIDYKTPIIQAHGREIGQIKESGNDAFGGNTSAEVQDRIRDSRLFRATTNLGQNLSQAESAENSAKTAGYMSLGGATAPIAWNPGGSTTTVQPFNWGGLLTGAMQGGAQLGAAAMAPGA